MARQWILARQEGFEAALEYKENVPVPSADELGPKEVLVKMMSASLNYRELQIPDPNGINGPMKPSVIPGCDGAGIVEAIGSAVQEFVPGDRVVTYVAPAVAEAKGDEGKATVMDAFHMLGQGVNGTLTSKGVFTEKALVHAPRSLDWLPAGTLTCNWLTAYNILFDFKGREVGPGTWILVQGTGGVSVAVLQVAVAAGATVVATTSSEDKAARLRSLGAAHTVNYRTSPDSWAQEARALTPDGRGFDSIVDIGGNQTLGQSLQAMRPDGVLNIVGGVGDATEPVPMFACFFSGCVVRPILGGNRMHFKKMMKYIDEKGIKPAVDDVVFELADAKDAYRRLKEKKHFAKVVIRIDHEA